MRMPYPGVHLTDQQLLAALDGELSPREAKRAAMHMQECWKCRSRQQELETAITDFMKVQECELPPACGPAALLRARLAELATETPHRGPQWLTLRPKLAWPIAAVLFVCIVALFGFRSPVRFLGRPSRNAVVSVPDPRLTPGAAVLLSRSALCTQAESNNKAVPAAVQKKVFEAYGIAGAEPREYEVDYLITPALGGADDIHNLWPQSHSSTIWNAEVKDALENRLRQMVCDGSLDLVEAQREIAENWIEAYKRYFHTDKPLDSAASSRDVR
jgi:hypothetical protein